MRIQIRFRIIGDDNSVISEDEILHFDKDDDRLEALSFANSKAILVGIQERMVRAQAASFLERHRCCDSRRSPDLALQGRVPRQPSPQILRRR